MTSPNTGSTNSFFGHAAKVTKDMLDPWIEPEWLSVPTHEGYWWRHSYSSGCAPVLVCKSAYSERLVFLEIGCTDPQDVAIEHGIRWLPVNLEDLGFNHAQEVEWIRVSRKRT